MEATKGSWGLLLAGEEKGRHGGAAGELGSPGGQDGLLLWKDAQEGVELPMGTPEGSR